MTLYQKIYHGSSSFIGMLLFPVGWWWCRSIKSFATPERLDRGCVFVLSGIQGKSPIEFGMSQGLNDGGVKCGIRIFEWTTGLWPLFLFHLRAKFWHQRMAQKLAKEIEAYRLKYPDRPIYLIGHSGGAGLSLMAANQLSKEIKINKIILLGPAVSRKFEYSKLLNKTEAGIWNFSSDLDFLFLGLGTCLAGTMDGRHQPSAGMIQFADDHASKDSPAKFHQIRYSFRYLKHWNFGGHFGYTNRLFIATKIAPLIREEFSTQENLG